ncbi:MAG: hypothetical protein EB127_01825, partial [Alphaproteobacteria bacterium]|nr:hypothetical protein [Alphaproteobacteria bacterium]
YKYKILSDIPVGYWELSSVNSGSNYDITSKVNNALFSASFSTPALVLNSGSAAKIFSNSSSIQINNSYNIFNINNINNSFSMELWFSLNNTFQDNGYALNQTASGYFTNNQLNILKILNRNTGSLIGRIFYDYDANAIKYSVSGSNSAYYYIYDNTTTFHIVAGYNAGTISLSINNKSGITNNVSDFSLIQSASTASNVLFVIDGSSINTNNSSSPYFLVNNLAFYDYLLSPQQIQSHINWRTLDDGISQISYFNKKIDYFDLNADNIQYAWYTSINGKEMSEYYSASNLTFDINGLSTISDSSSSTYGSAAYFFNTGNNVFEINGSYINWDAPDNVNATISYDNEATWIPLNKNAYINQYDYSLYQPSIKIKFDINRRYYSSYNKEIQINNLRLGTYKNYNPISDYLNYTLTASTVGSYNTHAFTDINLPIISRTRNIGINFKPDSSSNVPSYAIIYSASSIAYGVEFWLKIDDLQSSKSSSPVYLLNTSSYSLYYTASNPVLRFASAAQMFVYVNGASVSNSSYKLSKNEYYHIATSHSSSVSSNIYLNGGVSNSGSYNANATYGHIAIWNTQPSQTDIQNRYNLFIKNQINVASARDTNTFIYNTSYSENVYTIESGN